MGRLAHDLRFAIRLLARSPLFTIAAVLSLALGIGVNTAVFSYLNALFLRPLPAVEEPQRVLSLYSALQGSPSHLPISYPNYLDLAKSSESFSGLAAYQTIWVGMATGSAEPEQVVGEMVAANYFEVLGVEPLLGRTFTAEDAAVPSGETVVVLSHSLWESRFSGDPGVLGRKISINGQPFTVIGVAAKAFKGPSSFSPAQLWVPLGLYQIVFIAPELLEVRSAQLLQVIGRLEPGRSLRAAEAEMTRLAALLEREHPGDNQGITLSAVPLSQANLPPARRASWLKAGLFLSAIAGILLLAACANVANLLLVRVAARRKEMALRLSLGAGRRDLFRQLMSESLILALLGGGCSLAVTFWLWNLIVKLKPPFFSAGALDMEIDGRVLGFALLVTVLTGVLFGLAPMLVTLKVDLASILKDSEGVERRPLGLSAGRLLLVGQVSLCVVTVACAGLFLRSLSEAQRIDPGFEVERLLTVSFDLQSQGYDEARGRSFQEQLFQRGGSLPGVEHASLGENRPLGGFRFFRSLSKIGPHAQSREDAKMVGSSLVDASYFTTLGVPLLQGRAFTTSDRPGSPPVAIVSRTLARQLWPAGFTPGTRLWLDDEELPVEVVGVAQDIKHIHLDEDPRPALYLPLGQRYSGRATLHLRTSGAPGPLLDALKREARALDPSLPLIDLETASDTVRRSLWAPRVNAVLLALLSGLVLSLAAVGVYGVAAYSMLPRQREIAIRMALGETRLSVVRGFVRSGGLWLAAGVVAGLAVSFVLGRWLSSFVHGLGKESGLVFATTAAILLAVGLLANVVPVLRATRINPAEVLRAS